MTICDGGPAAGGFPLAEEEKLYEKSRHSNL